MKKVYALHLRYILRLLTLGLFVCVCFPTLSPAAPAMPEEDIPAATPAAVAAASTAPIAVAEPAPARAPAPPASVLFYPNEVQLTVEESLKPEVLPGRGTGFVIALPQNALRGSFSVSVNGTPAGSYYWLDREEDLAVSDAVERAQAGNADTVRLDGAGYAIARQVVRSSVPPELALPIVPGVPPAALLPERESDPKRRVLLKALVDLQEEMDGIAAKMAAADARIALWQQPTAEKESTAESRLKIDEALDRLLPELISSRQKLHRLHQDTSRLRAEADKRLREYDTANLCQLVVIPAALDAGATAKSAVIGYSYILPGSCRTMYTVGAFPSEGKLGIEQHALLQQSSGFSWNGAEVFISTTRRDTTLQPAGIPPWIIQLSSRNQEAGLSRARRAEAPSFNAAQMAEMQAVRLDEERISPPAPAQEEKGTFRLWSLGKRNIGSGVPVSVPLSAEQYTADYHYTLRPALYAKGFLTAALSFDKALELPAGQARFFVDNISVGERTFALNGDKAVIFFGSDPQISGEMKEIRQTQGEQGFISKAKNVVLHWNINVKNTRNRPVKVYVEDPQPVAMDTAVKVEVASTPEPEEIMLKPQQGGAKIYRWTLDLQPGEMRTINHKVELSAPADKEMYYHR